MSTLSTPENPGASFDFSHALLRNQQSLLAAIVESSDDAILSKDLTGRITSWNRGAERIFGYKAEEIIGASIQMLIPEELRGEEKEIIERLRRGERIEHFETMRLCKTGERIELSLTISPVRDQGGCVIGASKVARDTLERRRMERLLIQSEKLAATGRMATTIAHEINNPLEAITNLLFLARTSPSVQEEVSEYLRLAEREVERVTLIVRQTLGYFRDTAAPVSLHVEELLEHVLGVYESKLTNYEIEVERSFAPTCGLHVRRGEVTQVFSNMISNAIDAMLTGGRLFLHTCDAVQDGLAGVEVRIEDNGSGIPEEVQAKLFQPFFTTKKTRGTGIGLWISHQFIQGYGGTIEIESGTSGPTRGTRCKIFLPVHSPNRGRGPLPSTGETDQ